MPQKKKLKGLNKSSVFAAFVLVIILITAISSYGLGYQAGTAKPVNINIDELSNIEQPEGSEPRVDFSLFWEVWGDLKDKHPDFADVDAQNLVYGAIQGLTEALGDPNTVFFRPDDSQRFGEDISGHFTGIGAEIDVRNEQLIVVAPLEGSPASKAGLLPGDAIIYIDGESTHGINLDQAVKSIRGPRGTTVVLTIRREGSAANQEISIVRDDIQVSSVKTELLENRILYVRISSFSANTPIIFYSELAKRAFTPFDGVILDLRDNPGGFLDIGIDAASWFIGNDKLVVKEAFSSGDEEEFYSMGSGVLEKLPVVVLVNGGSASASEILAGAIRFHKDAKLVGTQTFGKGTVQQLDRLGGGSSLKVTIAHWLLPDGSLIEGQGLTPDVIVEQNEEDTLDNVDTQLKKAIEVLKESI